MIHRCRGKKTYPLYKIVLPTKRTTLGAQLPARHNRSFHNSRYPAQQVSSTLRPSSNPDIAAIQGTNTNATKKGCTPLLGFVVGCIVCGPNFRRASSVPVPHAPSSKYGGRAEQSIGAKKSNGRSRCRVRLPSTRTTSRSFPK